MNSIQLIKECVINYINNGQIQKVLERNFIKNNEHEFINVVNEYCKLYNVDRWIEKLYLYLNNKVPGKCSCDEYTSFIDYNIREYRLKYNKQKLIKSDLLIDGETELECMHRLGHYRLFDCGSKLWRFKN